MLAIVAFILHFVNKIVYSAPLCYNHQVKDQLALAESREVLSVLLLSKGASFTKIAATRIEITQSSLTKSDWLTFDT